MTALQMFEEMGWKEKRNDEYYLIWYFDLSECGTKEDCYIVFDKSKLVLSNRYAALRLDRDADIFVSQHKTPMLSVNDEAKTFFLSKEHHLAIHQQMKELGWLK